MEKFCGSPVLWTDPDIVSKQGGAMQFHLTYEGPLKGAGSTTPDHKHDLRRVFHRQLKRLWGTHQFLKDVKHGSYINAPNINPDLPMWEGLAQRYRVGSYRFVPLVREELAFLSTSCSFVQTFPEI